MHVSDQAQMLSAIRGSQIGEGSQGTVVSIDQWSHVAAGFILGYGSDLTTLLSNSLGPGWGELTASGTSWDPAFHHDRLSWTDVALRRGSTAGIDLTMDNGDAVELLGISGFSAPDVGAIRIESTLSVRTVQLADVQVSEVKGVFVAVGVPPFTVTPILSNGCGLFVAERGHGVAGRARR